MASGPLSWFRKYQRLMLGVFGVLLMFVFTLSFGSGVDPIIDYLSGGGARTSADPVVVTWKHGKITSSELSNLRTSRASLVRMLQVAAFEASKQGVQIPPNLPISTNINDESILELMILSREAEKMGVSVNDEAILGFLARFTGGAVAPRDYLNIWNQITGGGSSEAQLLNILRREIAARKMIGMAASGNYATSPIQYWDYFNRMERFVSCELMAVPVEEYVDQVNEPSESQLKGLYEEFKNVYPVDGSADPGFKRRLRRSFDYVQVDYNDFLAAEIAKITDAQVAEYYEANKEEFRETLPVSDLELGAELGDSSPMNEQPTEEAAGANDSEPAESEDTDQANEQGVESSSDEEMTESASDAAATNADSGTSEENETPTQPEPTTEDEPPADNDAPAEQDGNNDAGNNDAGDGDNAAPTFSPVPQQQEQEPADEPDNPLRENDDAADQAPSPNPDPPAEMEDAADAPAEPPVDEVTEEPNTAQPPPEANAAETPAVDEVNQAELGAEDATSDEPVKYKPIEDVTETIKDALAAAPAKKAFLDALSKIQNEMDRYYRKYTMWQLNPKQRDELPQPPLPDFASIQSVVPFNVESMPMSDRFEAAGYALGQSYDFEFTASNIRQVPFSEGAYTDNLPIYQPTVFPSGEAVTKFVYWVTGEEKSYVPEFADVRDEVLRAWRLRQARELAVAAAEADAVDARQSADKPLSESVKTGGRNFFTVDDISWLTSGNVGFQGGAQLRPAEIPGIEYPGESLLRTIFRLAPGEVGVAMDEPQSAAYAVKVTSSQPEAALRHEQFLNTSIVTPTMMQMAGGENRMFIYNWYRDLMDEYDVDWQLEPDSRQ